MSVATVQDPVAGQNTSAPQELGPANVTPALCQHPHCLTLLEGSLALFAFGTHAGVPVQATVQVPLNASAAKTSVKNRQHPAGRRPLSTYTLYADAVSDSFLYHLGVDARDFRAWCKASGRQGADVLPFALHQYLCDRIHAMGMVYEDRPTQETLKYDYESVGITQAASVHAVLKHQEFKREWPEFADELDEVLYNGIVYPAYMDLLHGRDTGLS